MRKAAGKTETEERTVKRGHSNKEDHRTSAAQNRGWEDVERSPAAVAASTPQTDAFVHERKQKFRQTPRVRHIQKKACQERCCAMYPVLGEMKTSTCIHSHSVGMCVCVCWEEGECHHLQNL